jgi:carbon-monoxide dehydrogenase medium subunit
MKPLPMFNLHKPKTLDDALYLMDSLESVKPIAGGTDLLPLMRERAIKAEDIVDLQHLEELKGIKMEGELIRIGAMTTLTEILKSPLIGKKVHVLSEAVAHVGSVQIRNQGTLAGNICNASPAADTAPALLVLDAKATIASTQGTKKIPVRDVFAGPKMNSLEKNELLSEILVHCQPLSSGAAFEKLGRRRGITLALLNAAAYLEMEGNDSKDARVALGATAITPFRLPEVEEMLKEKILTNISLQEASNVCQDLVSPVDDVRASAEYRREMSCVLVRRAIQEALRRAGGGA